MKEPAQPVQLEKGLWDQVAGGAGSQMDPDGAQGDEGSQLDPDGARRG